jgi:hypothetical protein
VSAVVTAAVVVAVCCGAPAGGAEEPVAGVVAVDVPVGVPVGCGVPSASVLSGAQTASAECARSYGSVPRTGAARPPARIGRK